MEAVAKKISASQAEALSERRCRRRFEVEDAIIATSQLTVIGHIMDLSESGLSFRYVASRGTVKDEDTLSLLVNDRTFGVKGVPFEVVWDVPMPERYSFNRITMRYCGVEFRDLNDRQRFCLKYFIQNYSLRNSEY